MTPSKIISIGLTPIGIIFDLINTKISNCCILAVNFEEDTIMVQVCSFRQIEIWLFCHNKARKKLILFPS